MRYAIVSIILALAHFTGKGQSGTTTVIYDGNGNVIGGSHIRIARGKPITVIDSISGNMFALDSAHIMISAFNKRGEVLWKTDPWLDNKIEIYRTARPVIVDFLLAPTDSRFSDRIPNGTTVLWIRYINAQFGFLDLKDGKFFFCGQD